MDRLKLEQDWCVDQIRLKMAVRVFYANMYAKEPCLSCRSEEWSFQNLTHRDRHWLNRLVTEEEIHQAVFPMGPLKALGPDGFSQCLFQRFWHILGSKVVEAVQGMFLRSQLIPGINEALICLIPKGEQSETLNQFQPISLCNVLCKVVSKVPSNRLKPLMSMLTGMFQAALYLVGP